MWKLLRNRQVLGLKFRRQFSVGPYILDFYCPAIRLCIELDGAVHHNMEAECYDSERTGFLLNECGIHVIRFDNDDVVRNPEGVVREIERVVDELLGINPSEPHSCGVLTPSYSP